MLDEDVREYMRENDPVAMRPNSMATTLLAADDVRDLVQRMGRDAFMDEMISALRHSFEHHRADRVDARARDGFRYDKPDLGLIEWMPSHEVGGPVVVKMVGYHPSNPHQRDLPSVLATSYLWDTDTGHLVAIADATFLTAIRTGAASAIAADLMAKEGSIDVAVVGLGAQSVTQLHALSRVRPIRRVVGFDTSDEASASFADRIAFLGVDVEIVADDQRGMMLAECDVLITCTSVDIGAASVIPDGASRSWLHVNAVGADFPGKVELPRSLVDQSLIVPDTLEQCLAEGECQVLDRGAIGPELFAMTQTAIDDVDSCSVWQQQRTVFDSTGWSIEDDVALRLTLRLAAAHGIGSTIDIECISTDPLDPYSFPQPLAVSNDD